MHPEFGCIHNFRHNEKHTLHPSEDVSSPEVESLTNPSDDTPDTTSSPEVESLTSPSGDTSDTIRRRNI